MERSEWVESLLDEAQVASEFEFQKHRSTELTSQSKSDQVSSPSSPSDTI
jgi:hypothetical protein